MSGSITAGERALYRVIDSRLGRVVCLVGVYVVGIGWLVWTEAKQLMGRRK